MAPVRALDPGNDLDRGTVSIGILGSFDSGGHAQGTFGYAFTWQWDGISIWPSIAGAPFVDYGSGGGFEGLFGGLEFGYSGSTADALGGLSYGGSLSAGQIVVGGVGYSHSLDQTGWPATKPDGSEVRNGTFFLGLGGGLLIDPSAGVTNRDYYHSFSFGNSNLIFGQGVWAHPTYSHQNAEASGVPGISVTTGPASNVPGISLGYPLTGPFGNAGVTHFSPRSPQ